VDTKAEQTACLQKLSEKIVLLSHAQWRPALLSIMALILSFTMARGQEWFNEKGLDPQSPRTPPFRVDDRPVARPDEMDKIEDVPTIYVQLEGRWVPTLQACPGAEGKQSQKPILLVTDTLMRFEDGTCSVRDMNPQDSSTTVRALCATPGGYEDRTITLIRKSPEKLTVSYQGPAGERRREDLIRCP
jgi:hypothetical protein